jgi:hypothetical protein
VNIFILDHDLKKSIEYHVDKHIVKMPLEAAQMMSTALWVDHLFGYVPRALDKSERDKLNKAKKEVASLPQSERPLSPYLPTMYNHPCTIWVRTSYENYAYTFNYAAELCDEYTYRYGKIRDLEHIVKNYNIPKNLPNVGLTQFALALSDAFPPNLRDPNNPVQTYRYFYMLDKATFAQWKFRSKPEWWDESVARYDKRISGR